MNNEPRSTAAAVGFGLVIAVIVAAFLFTVGCTAPTAKCQPCAPCKCSTCTCPQK